MPRFTLHRATAAPFLALGAVALLALLLPFPGSLSVVATRTIMAGGLAIPGIPVVSEIALVALAITTVAAIAITWFREPARRTALVGAAAGVTVAYGLSELTKLLVGQARPCSRWAAAADCPPAGDWSFPSNHAVLAGGAAIVIAVAAGRAWLVWAAAITALVVAAGRVAQGAHYVHDVAAGLLLGFGVTIALALIAARARSRYERGARR
ncbi:phosphatase PAP2 family protein [Agromyces atrinae]|uniref:phosphatase PAP2 family protein n=1 Tax=Agromyces atrinae TaxID=592376 RepID=UPI001F55BE43|nr:phosphatase PAP2 family protein [Agromyces atrinae]MCI2956697.1 phosphatase PAP2 family protein [Agromyces atrinae]